MIPRDYIDFTDPFTVIYTNDVSNGWMQCTRAVFLEALNLDTARVKERRCFIVSYSATFKPVPINLCARYRSSVGRH